MFRNVCQEIFAVLLHFVHIVGITAWVFFNSTLYFTFLYRVRWELIQEEKKIMKALESGGANDALDTRLGEVRTTQILKYLF